MATQTGRTPNKWTTVKIDDSGGTLREIAVSKIGEVGLTYEEKDLTALIDAIKGVLLGMPDFTTTLEGPVDTTATTGSHVVLSGVNGGNTPLSFGVFVGMRHVWESGEPVFGITSTTANGVLVNDYKVNFDSMTYKATIKMANASAAPAWGTTAIT
jgi:hypothetical protein